MPLVFFQILKDASTAIGIAVAVDVASGSSSILKHLLTVLTVVQQLGHHGTHLWVLFHIVQQRVKPSLWRAHVTVEQHCVGVHRLLNGEIITQCKAVVSVKFQDFDLREFLLKYLQAVVGASIVGNNNVGNGIIGACNHCRQITSQQFCSVPVQYDDSNFFHSLITWASTLRSSFRVNSFTFTIWLARLMSGSTFTRM